MHKTYKSTMNCERCGKEITRKTPQQKYCIKCGNIVNKEHTRANYQKRKLLYSNRDYAD